MKKSVAYYLIRLSKNAILYSHSRDVAQLVARLVWDQNVAGSSPVIPIKGLHNCKPFFYADSTIADCVQIMEQLIKNFITWIPSLLEGAKITVGLTVLSVSAGLVLSVFLAMGKISKNKILNAVSSFYIFFFRGTPLLLQLYFVYYGLPKISPNLTIESRFMAAFITFSLNSGAYLAEVVRAAIVSIDRGQLEASMSLGFSYGKSLKFVIIPQTITRLLPPVGNEFILVLKDASLVSIIALSDITRVTQNIASSTSSSLVYIPAMIIYLVITAFFSWTFRKLEKKSITA